MSFSSRVAELRIEAGQAGDSRTVDLCERAESGEMLDSEDVDKLLEILEIPAKEFWAEAGGGDKVPMTIADCDYCV